MSVHIRRVSKKITITKQSIEEIRRENHPYFEALAEQMGEVVAREAEERYLAEIAQELQGVAEGETVEVPMVQITFEAKEVRES